MATPDPAAAHAGGHLSGSDDSLPGPDEPCECGCPTDGHGYNACSHMGLRNSLTFPSVKDLTDAHSPSLIYYSLRGGAFCPRRNWCLLGQIEEAPSSSSSSSSPHPTVKLRTRFDEQVAVTFLPSPPDQQPRTFAWSDLQPGSTLLIAFANRRSAVTASGARYAEVCQEDLDSVFVIPARQNAVLLASDGLATAEAALRASCGADGAPPAVAAPPLACCWRCWREGAPAGEPALAADAATSSGAGGAGPASAALAKPPAAGSGAGGVSLLRCSKCRLAQYCSRECQAVDWGRAGQHRQLCGHLGTIQAVMDWAQRPFQDFRKWD